MKVLLGYVVTYVYLIGVLWFSNILKVKFSLSEEISRKVVHVLVGFSYFIMVYFFWNVISFSYTTFNFYYY